MTTPFLTLITNLLYTQPILLPALLRGLSQLVSSTQTLLGSTAPSDELRKQFGLDQTSAAENMQLLRKLAKDMVSVLLNVFSKMPRESRGMVGDVISIWVGIMTEKVRSFVELPLSLLKTRAGHYRHVYDRVIPPFPKYRLHHTRSGRYLSHTPHHARSPHHFRPISTGSPIHCALHKTYNANASRAYRCDGAEEELPGAEGIIGSKEGPRSDGTGAVGAVCQEDQ